MLKFVNPFNWLKWMGQFVYAYFLSIPWGDASKAIPAMVLLIGVLVASAVAYSDGNSWRNRRITKQLVKAYESDDFETAELVLRRQIAERPEDTDARFRLGLVNYEQDQVDEAMRMMKALVARDRHVEAAEWLLKNEYIGKNWKDLSVAQQAEFGELLDLLRESKPDNVTYLQLQADYFIASQRFANAIDVLRRLMVVQPMRGLQAAAISRRMGNSEAAVELAKRTLEKVEEIFEEDPANPVLALAIVQNQIFLEEYGDAVRTLNQSIRRMKTKEHRQQLQQAMGDTIVLWINKIDSEPREEDVKQMRILKMLQVALEFAPNNPRVLTLVADQVLKTLESEDEAVIAIRNALVKGTSPGIAHFVRGTSYLMKDEAERATRHLKMAAEFLPNSSAILNNLAVAMASKENGDLEQALKLIEQAISQTKEPGPYFYETRGQILFKLAQYTEAIPDLERALVVEALAVNAHNRLAECYEKLDEPELAEEHRQAAIDIAKAIEERKEEEPQATG